MSTEIIGEKLLKKKERVKFANESFSLKITFLLLYLQCSFPVPGFPCTPRRFSSARNLQHKNGPRSERTFPILAVHLSQDRNNQNFRPELFKRGWRRRYFNPAWSRGRGGKWRMRVNAEG